MINKFFSYWHSGEMPEGYKSYLERNRLNYQVDLLPLDITLDSHDNPDPRIPSDEFRMKKLLENPSLNWIDSDILILKPIDFELEAGKVYMFKVGFYYDVSVIIGNNSDYFKELFSYNNDFNQLAWWDKVICFTSKYINLIPDGYFAHK